MTDAERRMVDLIRLRCNMATAFDVEQIIAERDRLRKRLDAATVGELTWRTLALAEARHIERATGVHVELTYSEVTER